MGSGSGGGAAGSSISGRFGRGGGVKKSAGMNGRLSADGGLKAGGLALGGVLPGCGDRLLAGGCVGRPVLAGGKKPSSDGPAGRLPCGYGLFGSIHYHYSL